MAKFRAGNQFGGQSPGRPKGVRDRLCASLDKHAEESGLRVLEAMLTAALNGDVAAGKVVMDRIWPQPRGRFLRIDIPFLAGAGDVERAAALTVEALAKGTIRTDESDAILDALKRFVEIKTGLELAHHLEDIARRLAQLESGKEIGHAH